MFTYSFLNNTDVPVSIKGKDGISIVVPAKACYVIKVGDSCPIQYKVELHRTKKIFTSGNDFILTLRKVHNMLKTVLYEWEVDEPKKEEPKVEEPEFHEEVEASVEEISETPVVEESISEELSSFKIIDFNPVMYVGKPEKILVKVDGDGRAVNFKISDKSVATITRFGNVYPQAPGNAEITVTYNGVTKILKLEVLPAESELEEDEE